jgi:hypothetical protein
MKKTKPKRGKYRTMKIKLKPQIRFRAAALALGISVAAASARADAGHWYAGALSTNQGGKLYFDWTPTGQGALDAASGVSYSLNYSNSGTFAGLFNGSSPTFTGLAQTTATGGTPSPNAAAFGSLLELSIVSLAGPAGGSFYFFNSNALSPTYVLGVGGTASSDVFQLSFGNGAAGADPYGHIHGRRFAVDLPGTYTLGVQLFDGGHNGVGGGPIQSASDIYYVTFATVPEPGVATLALVSLTGTGFAAWRSRRNRLK